MERRRFITLLGGAAAAWAGAASAQQAALPVVGFLASAPSADRVDAFRRGLAETGFSEDRNVAIEYRSADGRYERLSALAAELVRRPVAVIAASGITATRAARTSTATIPIVFNTGGDPVKLGLVASLAKPDGNLTGVATLGKVLVGKQLELLHELLPAAAPVAFLVNPSNAVAREEIGDARTAAGALRRQLIVVEAAGEREFDEAFVAAKQQRAGALLMQADPFFSSRRDQLVALAARHAVPAISPFLDYAPAGGLLSYGSSITDALRLVGNYTGRILKGEKPADLPVQQAVKVELVVNLKTAKAIGLTLPTAILLRADEVVE
jgi:putative tryptophan/tyrosine transport system substrate-binding protein